LKATALYRDRSKFSQPLNTQIFATDADQPVADLEEPEAHTLDVNVRSRVTSGEPAGYTVAGQSSSRRGGGRTDPVRLAG
jgi:hypothetical protein